MRNRYNIGVNRASWIADLTRTQKHFRLIIVDLAEGVNDIMSIEFSCLKRGKLDSAIFFREYIVVKIDCNIITQNFGG